MTNARKSGSRPFSPIYKNFQNLLDHNQGIFRLFRKTKNPGMYQAVWQARQGEVDTLKERLTETEIALQAKNDQIDELQRDWQNRERDWFEQHIDSLDLLQSSQQKVRNLEEETIEGLEKEIAKWKEKSCDYREEVEKLTTLTRSLNRVIEMKTKENEKLSNDFSKQKSHLSLSQHALIKLDDEYESLKEDHKELKCYVENLEEELKKAQTYAKEFKKINHRMENELYRVNHELERAQALMN